MLLLHGEWIYGVLLAVLVRRTAPIGGGFYLGDLGFFDIHAARSILGSR